jgi:preprotein translocase subunit YajC
LELGAVGVGELWLEPEWDPRKTQVNIFTFFLVCLFCLFCLFFFVMFLWSCAATQHSEEGNGSVVAIAFFFFFSQRKKQKEEGDGNKGLVDVLDFHESRMIHGR